MHIYFEFAAVGLGNKLSTHQKYNKQISSKPNIDKLINRAKLLKYTISYVRFIYPAYRLCLIYGGNDAHKPSLYCCQTLRAGLVFCLAVQIILTKNKLNKILFQRYTILFVSTYNAFPTFYSNT